jgi:hypothetical protein
MKTTTWRRKGGYVSVILFDSGKSAAVGTNVCATQKGAESQNTRVDAMCGPGYSLMDLPWSSTDPETGEITVHYRRENLSPIPIRK